MLEGVGHILAEAISEMATVRDAVRKVVWKTGKIVTTKAEIPEGQGLEYRDYFDYSEPIAQIPPHRVLAINRGDKEGPLKVRLEVSRPDLEAVLFSQLPLEGHPQAELFRAAAIDALDRLILPSMEREVRRDLTEAAEKHAVEVFARNLRSLLLQPPIPKQVVLAIDPGFRTGCKVAVLDRQRQPARPGGDLPAPAPESPVRGQAVAQGPGRQAPGRRRRDRQRHRLPRDRGAGRRDHRRGNAVQPGRRGDAPPAAEAATAEADARRTPGRCRAAPAATRRRSRGPERAGRRRLPRRAEAADRRAGVRRDGSRPRDSRRVEADPTSRSETPAAVQDAAAGRCAARRGRRRRRP